MKSSKSLAIILSNGVIEYVIGEDDMRYRTWQNGYLFKEDGKWKLRFREDQIQPDGSIKRVPGKRLVLGPCEGPGRLTRTVAEQLRRSFAEQINQSLQVRSLMTVRDFVGGVEHPKTGKPWGRFVPEYVLVRAESPNTKRDYLHVLDRHILPFIGHVAISDVTHDQIARLIQLKSETLAGGTVRGVRKVLKLVFDHAIRCNLYMRANPTSILIMPRSKPNKITGYTWHEARKILEHLPEPIWTMAVLAMATSLNAAEMAGIRVRRVNLSIRPKVADDDVVPPQSIAIRENFTMGRHKPTKTGNRVRNVGIPDLLRDKIAKLCKGKNPDQALFMNAKGSGPVDMHNITNRRFGPLSKEIDIKVNWHRFRHTHATWTDELGMDPQDRMRLLGHGSLAMTQHYTHPEERLRTGSNALLEKLFEVERELEVVN